jgi:dTDP-glucose 4,6-dehydratase
MIENPVETIKTSVLGTINILDFLLKNNSKTKVIYLSSMEVYAKSPTDELRSSYTLSKKLCENICISYASEYGLDISIARLAQVFGAGVSILDNHVYSQFARSIIEKKDIILHTKGEHKRDYCYLSDAATALFLIAKKGIKGEIYDVLNKENHLTVKEMAEIMAGLSEEIFKRKTKVIIEIQEDIKSLGYLPPAKIKMNAAKIESLGFSAKINMKESCRRLIFSIKEELLK